jgi:hypothetical protein
LQNIQDREGRGLKMGNEQVQIEMQEQPIIGLVTNCHSYGACKSAGVVTCNECPDFENNFEVKS